jgi:uncharacterized membrane protein
MSKTSKPQSTQPQHKGTVTVQKTYQGIIPSSDEMAKYEQIQPGFADRILKLTENEGAHRRKMEKRIVNWAIRTRILGLLLGFVSVTIVSYICYFAFTKGYATQAAGLGATVLVSLASAFAYRQHQNKDK